jgi:hypothetical protein
MDGLTWILIGREMPERHESGESDVSALCYGSLKTAVKHPGDQDSNSRSEMDFLNINLTKDCRLLFHGINSQSLTLAVFKENHTLLWVLKILTKNPRN